MSATKSENSFWKFPPSPRPVKWGVFIALFFPSLLTGQLYLGEGQSVYFRSDAPLELIEARSTDLRCALRNNNREFAFRVGVKSFRGFNSELQKEHFNENYLESNQYPDATFQGRIIEKIDLSQPGEHQVRAKGTLTVRGQQQERIIRATVKNAGNKLVIRSTFSVPLADHGIEIPRIVYQKIAEEILVSIEAELQLVP